MRNLKISAHQRKMQKWLSIGRRERRLWWIWLPLKTFCLLVRFLAGIKLFLRSLPKNLLNNSLSSAALFREEKSKGSKMPRKITAFHRVFLTANCVLITGPPFNRVSDLASHSENFARIVSKWCMNSWKNKSATGWEDILIALKFNSVPINPSQMHFYYSFTLRLALCKREMRDLILKCSNYYRLLAVVDIVMQMPHLFPDILVEIVFLCFVPF